MMEIVLLLVVLVLLSAMVATDPQSSSGERLVEGWPRNRVYKRGYDARVVGDE